MSAAKDTLQQNCGGVNLFVPKNVCMVSASSQINVNASLDMEAPLVIYVSLLHIS